MKRKNNRKILLLANTSWYLYNFRYGLIKKLISENYDVIIVAPIDKYTNKLKSENITFERWNLNRSSINPVKEISSIIKLINIYRKYSPELTHHFTIKACLYGSIASRIATNSKIINHITGLGPSFFTQSRRVKFINWLIKPIYKFALDSNGSKIIFHNYDDKSVLKKLGLCKEERSIVIKGSGVDTAYFYRLHKKQAFTFPLQILFPARVIEEKGFVELIIACKQLWDENLDFILNVAGDVDQGNRSSFTREQIDLLINQNNKIRFHERTDNIKDLYSKADIVVLPSWREGLSLALVEASSMELPIVTTDVPGCREVIEHKVSGLVVPPRDSLKLKEAIKFLILNKQVADSYGEKAREVVEKEYSIEKINGHILRVYHQLI